MAQLQGQQQMPNEEAVIAEEQALPTVE